MSPPAASALPGPVARTRALVAWLLLVLVAFLQQGGAIVADTKLDLVIDPGRFLARALSAWDPQAAFGQVQNQAYGYLWPMGPFFWVGDALGAPAWLVQRCWWVLLLTVAFVGVLRLGRVLDVGTPTTRIVAAFGYAVAPRVLSSLGAISVESWPGAVLPWVLIPLVAGARRGSTRRAAALSGLAVACLGGVNAAASLAVLVVPMLFLLTRTAGPRRRALTGWWLLAVVLATTWWLLPLLVLARYGYPFLTYIESAMATTAPVSGLNVLRGTDHWLGFLVGDAGPAWPAGFWLSTTAAAVIATAALAAWGLGGLLSRGMPERRWLVLSLLAGSLAIGLGYAGASGSPLAEPVRALLDGALSAFRNVHKFDALVRLPLALGLAVGLARARELLAPAARVLLDPPLPRRVRLVATGMVAALVALPLLVVLVPAAEGRLPMRGSFLEVPEAWSEAADFLQASAPQGGRALLVPSSNFGEYTWGRPLDEPLQALARSPWAVRNAVPLGAPGATRWLDGVQELLSRGEPSTTLAASLAAAGVSDVVLRNDMDPFAAAPPAAAARAALLGSPGLVRVAVLGPRVPVLGALPAGTSTPTAALASLEVFRVTGATTTPRVTAASEVGAVVGGPEALAGTALAGRAWLLGPDAGTGRAAGVTGATVVGTDTMRWRSRNFGAQRERDLTPTLPAGADIARGRPAGDVSPFPAGTDATTVELVGATSVSASSSAADPFLPGYLGPDRRAFAAVDGDPSSGWVSGIGDAAPWWELTMAEREVRTATVVVAAGAALSPVDEVRVTTAAGSATAPVTKGRRGTARATVTLPAGATSWLRVQPRARPGARVAVLEVQVPGLVVSETVVPTPAAGATGLLLQRSRDDRRACLLASADGWTCGEGLARAGEESRFDRRLSLDAALAVTDVTVAARPGAALDAALDAALGRRVAGSSAAVDDPAARPGAAVDGDRRTGWITAADDRSPVLTLTSASPVTLRSLALQTDEVSAARIRSVMVSTESGRATVRVTRGRLARFPELTGRRWVFRLATTPAATGVVGSVRLDELVLPGWPPPASGRIVVPCDDGPVLVVGGRRTPLRVDTTAAAVVEQGRVAAETCAEAQAPTGASRLTAEDTSQFVVDGVTLGRLPAAAAPAATVTVALDEPQHRVWQVGAGPAAVVDMPEGANPGWVATVGGAPLAAVRLDGWRQGWVVPASGDVRVVDVVFTPGGQQRAGLVLGGLLLLLLIPLAVVRPRRPPPAPAPAAPALRGERTALALAVPGLLAGAAGLVVGAVVLILRRRTPTSLPPLAVAALLASSAVAAASATSWGQGLAAAVVHVLAVVSLAAAAAVGGPRRSAPARPDPVQERTLDEVEGRRRDEHGAGHREHGDQQEAALEGLEPQH